MNPVLSIVIPTYERLESLRINLPSLLEDAMEFSIAVYVSDDSPSKAVSDFCSELKTKHANIFYSKNESRLGHDGNFLASLAKSSADYTWIIGDRVSLKKGAIKSVIDVIYENKVDIISVNKVGRNINFDTGYYEDPLEVLENFGWHLTYTGATIYSRKVLNKCHEFYIEKYRNFPQIALIFNYLSVHCSFFWINDALLEATPSSQSYWTNNAFSVFIGDWENAISGLPAIYPPELKEDSILAHSKNTGLFNSKLFLKLRANGYFDSTVLREYRARLDAHSDISYVCLYCFSILPRWFIKLVQKLM